MCNFRIHKTGRYDLPWALDYPPRFSDIEAGQDFATFNEAVAAFIVAANRECPMCLKGAVVDTDWGWKCECCGAHDVAVGCKEPA